MKLMPNDRARQMLVMQFILLAVFVAALVNFIAAGQGPATYFPAVLAAGAAIMSLVSCIGFASYYKTGYLRIEGDRLYRAGLSFKKSWVDMTAVGGYHIAPGDTLTLFDRTTRKNVMDVRLVYLTDKDRRLLMQYIDRYAVPVGIERKPSLFDLLRGSGRRR